MTANPGETMSHTFSGLSVLTPVTGVTTTGYTLKLTSAGLTSATTSAITVK